MKAVSIIIMLMGAAFVQAQNVDPSLGLTPGSMAATPADSTAAPVAPVAQPQSRHMSLTESWREERNAIREGNTFAADSNWHKALQCYDRALMENGASLRARYNKAVALSHLGAGDNAGTENDPRVQAAALFAQVAQDARQNEPDLARRALYNLGNLAYGDEKYDQAIKFYESSLRLDPSQYNARYNLRLAQLKKQQQQNQDQNQDQNQQEQQQEQQQQEQQQQQQQQEQQQPQEQPMTQSAEQILQAMQNQENQTRQRVQQDEPQQGRRGQPDKPW